MAARFASLAAAGLTALFLAPAPARAQIHNCFDCRIGLWDDPTLSSNIGTIQPFVPKDVFLGIDFGYGTTQLTGIECSAAGLDPSSGLLLLSFEPIVPAAVIIGLLPAPVDTSSTSTGTGGVNVAWSTCRSGDQALVRVTLLALSSVTDRVLQVKRRYPTTNPAWRTPMVFGCDAPIFTAFRVTGDCYILNWSGDPNVPCETGLIGVEPASWSAVKQLYRD